MFFYNLKREAAMFFASCLSSVVREANSVAGFGLDSEFAETLSALLAKCRAAGLDFRISQGAAHAPEASRVLLPLVPTAACEGRHCRPEDGRGRRTVACFGAQILP